MIIIIIGKYYNKQVKENYRKIALDSLFPEKQAIDSVIFIVNEGKMQLQKRTLKAIPFTPTERRQKNSTTKENIKGYSIHPHCEAVPYNLAVLQF